MVFRSPRWRCQVGVSRSLRVMTVGLCLVAVGFTAHSESLEPATPAAEPPKSKNALDDMKAEIEIGRNMAGRLLAFYGKFEDKQLLGYLNQVGTYVAKAGDFPDRRYMFAILDSDSVNAFACPGGYILITRGTILHAKNEAEIAAVLGHEAAHVGLQHMYNTLRKLSHEEAEKMEAEADARRLNDEYAVARRRPLPQESETGAALAKFLMTANGAGLSVLQAAKAGMNMILEKGLDQKLEYEADGEGVKYAVRAGYDPKGLDQFLARLDQAKRKEKGEKSVMDKTHPSIPDRRKAIADELNKLDSSQITGAVLQGRFEGFQSRIAKKKRKKDQGA